MRNTIIKAYNGLLVEKIFMEGRKASDHRFNLVVEISMGVTCLVK